MGHYLFILFDKFAFGTANLAFIFTPLLLFINMKILLSFLPDLNIFALNSSFSSPSHEEILIFLQLCICTDHWNGEQSWAISEALIVSMQHRSNCGSFGFFTLSVPFCSIVADYLCSHYIPTLFPCSLLLFTVTNSSATWSRPRITTWTKYILKVRHLEWRHFSSFQP